MRALWLVSFRPIGKSESNDFFQSTFVDSVKSINFDITFSSSFLGGNEDAKASGTYTYNGTTQDPGMIKNGDSITINMVCSSLQNANTAGTIVYAYSPYFVPVTWNDNSNKTLARGLTTGSTGYLFWDTYGGSGTNYINGS